MAFHVAIPAYGRDYNTKQEVYAAWNAGKDFQLQPSGRYISRRELPPGDYLEIRYSRLTKLVVVN